MEWRGVEKSRRWKEGGENGEEIDQGEETENGEGWRGKIEIG